MFEVVCFAFMLLGRRQAYLVLPFFRLVYLIWIMHVECTKMYLNLIGLNMHEKLELQSCKKRKGTFFLKQIKRESKTRK